jgi:hypothetical protein
MCLELHLTEVSTAQHFCGGRGEPGAARAALKARKVLVPNIEWLAKRLVIPSYSKYATSSGLNRQKWSTCR